MKVGVFYSYFPHGEPVDWPNVLRRAAQDGADHVELSSMRLVRQDRTVWREVVQTARQLGLSYTFCTSLPPDGDVSSDDPCERQRGVDFIRANIELAAEMGGGVVGGMLHGSTKKDSGLADNSTRSRRMEFSAKAVQEMAETARDCGVRLGLELCNRYENTMLNTVDQGLDFLKMVDSPVVGLHLDTYHMNIEEDDLVQAVLKAGKHIVNVHACENNRKLPGMGHLNWKEILLALKAVGYQGALSMECFAIPFGPWRNSMCLWREYVRDGIDEDLTASVIYLKKVLETLGPEER